MGYFNEREAFLLNNEKEVNLALDNLRRKIGEEQKIIFAKKRYLVNLRAALRKSITTSMADQYLAFFDVLLSDQIGVIEHEIDSINPLIASQIGDIKITGELAASARARYNNLIGTYPTHTIIGGLKLIYSDFTKSHSDLHANPKDKDTQRKTRTDFVRLLNGLDTVGALLDIEKKTLSEDAERLRALLSNIKRQQSKFREIKTEWIAIKSAAPKGIVIAQTSQNKSNFSALFNHLNILESLIDTEDGLYIRLPKLLKKCKSAINNILEELSGIYKTTQEITQLSPSSLS